MAIEDLPASSVAASRAGRASLPSSSDGARRRCVRAASPAPPGPGASEDSEFEEGRFGRASATRQQGAKRRRSSMSSAPMVGRRGGEHSASPSPPVQLQKRRRASDGATPAADDSDFPRSPSPIDGGFAADGGGRRGVQSDTPPPPPQPLNSRRVRRLPAARPSHVASDSDSEDRSEEPVRPPRAIADIGHDTAAPRTTSAFISDTWAPARMGRRPRMTMDEFLRREKTFVDKKQAKHRRLVD